MVVWPLAFRFINKAVRSSKLSFGCFKVRTLTFRLVNKQVTPGFRKDFELRFSDCI